MKTETRESQRDKALRFANQIRLHNANVLAQIKRGELDPVVALETEELTVPLNRFLKAVPRVGEVVAVKIAKKAEVPYDHRLGGNHSPSAMVTEHQRGVLCEQLRSRGFGG